MDLDREEHVEQAYFFRTFRERMQEGVSSQELLAGVQQEILATTKLPMALEFMAGELRLTGGFGPAMARLSHYFTSFQTYVVREAEREEGRFDFRVALEILEREAEYHAKGASVQGIFLYQFETLCRNRLGYDRGLDAMAGDPVYDQAWREWITTVRRQVGIIDIADLIYVRSEHYRRTRGEGRGARDEGRETNDDVSHPSSLIPRPSPLPPVLFGEKEGKIALANRQKDPLFLFSALARHLGYPSVPRLKAPVSEALQFSFLQRRLERLESRIRLLEEELRGGINLARFYGPPKEAPLAPVAPDGPARASTRDIHRGVPRLRRSRVLALGYGLHGFCEAVAHCDSFVLPSGFPGTFLLSSQIAADWTLWKW